MPTYILGLGIGWLAWCGVNAAIAAQKHRSAAGVFALSLLGSPLLGFCYVLAVPALPACPRDAHLVDTADEEGRGSATMYILTGVLIVAALAFIFAIR